MSLICWVRVDDRLIHGQVTVAWRQYLRYDEICIVDAEVRGDLFLQDVLRLAAPAGVAVSVYDVEEAVIALARKGLSADVPRPQPFRGLLLLPSPCKVLVLIKSPQIVVALVEAGMPLSHLNVGNLSARPGSKRVFKTISLTREHAAALDVLAKNGVRITFQLTPDDAQVDWQAVRQRLKAAALPRIPQSCQRSLAVGTSNACANKGGSPVKCCWWANLPESYLVWLVD